MGEYLLAKQTERRSAVSRVQNVQNSSSTKKDEGKSSTKTNRKGVSKTAGTQTESRTQKESGARESVSNQTQDQTGNSSQDQTRQQTSQSTSQRNLTSENEVNEHNTEMVDVGATVKFTLKIRGGSGTVPPGSKPPSSPCT